MSRRGQLSGDAFGYYVSLGPRRTYRAVAKHYGVSKRTVSARAASEGWQQRIRDLEQKARAAADAEALELLRKNGSQHLAYQAELQAALRDVLTPERMRALVTVLIKTALQKGDVQAVRLLIERVLGKPRPQALQGGAVDIPEGLETTADVVAAANTLLKAVAEGTLSPEDAQRAAALVETARKTLETEELDKRLIAIEEELRRRGGR